MIIFHVITWNCHVISWKFHIFTWCFFFFRETITQFPDNFHVFRWKVLCFYGIMFTSFHDDESKLNQATQTKAQCLACVILLNLTWNLVRKHSVATLEKEQGSVSRHDVKTLTVLRNNVHVKTFSHYKQPFFFFTCCSSEPEWVLRRWREVSRPGLGPPVVLFLLLQNSALVKSVA